MYKTEVRGPLILGDKNYRQISSDIIAPIDQPIPTWWKAVFGISMLATLFYTWRICQTGSEGIGTWGVNNSVGWGW
ncbi:MAG TPA: hypothetical protein PLH09_11765, partial [Lentimicrobium sp.]|nr:hypothetical protein [Lentimicrobium sp.]